MACASWTDVLAWADNRAPHITKCINRPTLTCPNAHRCSARRPLKDVWEIGFDAPPRDSDDIHARSSILRAPDGVERAPRAVRLMLRINM